MDSLGSVWRWNVDDVWQSYSSMHQEMFSACEATNNIARYHHLTACLLFGACAVESFLNTNMRKFLGMNKINDEDIMQKLRQTRLKEKMEKWPSEICGVFIDSKYIDIISMFLELRNEVTHRKRKDHSLYKELDEALPINFVESVQYAFVTVYSGLDNSFPYWLLGWNFVGMNRDETHPCLSNNQQFKHALIHMGFRVPAWEYNAANAWEERNMKGLAAFHKLKNEFYNNAPIIEPKNPMFPKAPRLCKRWWNLDLIRRS